MGTHKNKAYTLRLDDSLMNKIRETAEKEDRPISKQIERILKQYYEQKEEQEKIENKQVNIGKNNNVGNINIK